MCFGRRTPDPALVTLFSQTLLSFFPLFLANSVSSDLKVSEHKDLKNQELKSSPSSLRAEDQSVSFSAYFFSFRH